jgi:hypothetical protein
MFQDRQVTIYAGFAGQNYNCKVSEAFEQKRIFDLNSLVPLET